MADSFKSALMEGLLDKTKTRSAFRSVNIQNQGKYMYGVTDSKASEKFSALLKNAKLSKDIAKLSPIYQTRPWNHFIAFSYILHPNQQHFHTREYGQVNFSLNACCDLT